VAHTPLRAGVRTGRASAQQRARGGAAETENAKRKKKTRVQAAAAACVATTQINAPQFCQQRVRRQRPRRHDHGRGLVAGRRAQRQRGRRGGRGGRKQRALRPNNERKNT
jgi:hypothetical protein